MDGLAKGIFVGFQRTQHGAPIRSARQERRHLTAEPFLTVSVVGAQVTFDLDDVGDHRIARRVSSEVGIVRL